MSDRGLWLVITGTGRCGTGYIARVLTSVGVNCTHEGVFYPAHTPQGENAPAPGLATVDEVRARARLNQENAWWGWQAESSWLAPPYFDIPEMRDVTVVHLVRHPKKVLDSQMRMEAFTERHGGKFYAFQRKHLPCLERWEREVDQAVLFYVRWNEWIERRADYFWRVEDNTRGLLDMLGLDHVGKTLYGDTAYNSRGGYRESDVQPDGIAPSLRTELAVMMERYGYEWAGL